MHIFGKRLMETTLDARSDAYRWLRLNYAEISGVFSTQAQAPSWKALAKTAADDGLAFTPNALRKAWIRLERDLEREGVAKGEKPEAGRPEAKPDDAVSPIRQRPTEPPITEDDDDDFVLKAASGLIINPKKQPK